MNDFKSYEPVEYGQLDSTFSSFETSTQYLKNNSVIDKFLDSAKNNREQYKSLLLDPDVNLNEVRSLMKISNKILDSAQTIADLDERIKVLFKPEFNGYSIKHSLRCKNALGVTILNSYTFFLNKDLSQVIRVAEKEE